MLTIVMAENRMLTEPIALASKKDCTGCMACLDSCHFNSIIVFEDSCGFRYPKINKDSCKKCGKCLKACPILNYNKSTKKLPTRCYAAKIQDQELIKGCTSGGLVTALVKFYLSNKDIVFGAAFIENEGVKHIKIETLNDLQKLKGSKYIQSRMDGVYIMIKNVLKNTTKKVLYIGTPCQADAVKMMFPSERILTVSFICGGVPSEKMYADYLIEKGVKYPHVKSILFRDKQTYLVKVNQGKGVFEEKRNESKYLQSYDDGFSIRQSCFNCKYCSRERPGDITVGDYWGIEKTLLKSAKEPNMSCILINTDKSENLIKNLPTIFLEESNINDIAKQNFRIDSVRHTDRLTLQTFIFRLTYPLIGFCRAVKTTKTIARLIINKYTTKYLNN